MVKWNSRALRVVGLTAAALAVLLGSLAARVGRPYPGFFVAPDFRVFPAEPGVPLEWGDRIVSVDGGSPVTLEARVAAAQTPVRYEIERAGRRATFEIAPRPFTWSLLLSHFGIFLAISVTMLAVGVAVFAQNPRARPNRYFLIYMCLWALSNVPVPESVLASSRIAACLVGFISIVLSVHGWVFFLTYPVNPARQAWLERHRVIPRLYAAAFIFGGISAITFSGVYLLAPEMFVDGWFYPTGVWLAVALAIVSFPVKILALLDTRRRAASPLVNQQITVLMVGIGLGLGLYVLLMLLPLTYLYPPPVDPQIGSA